MKRLSLIIILPIIISACSEDTTGPGGDTGLWNSEHSNIIEGRVLDQEGKGIPNAGIVINYHLEYDYDNNSGVNMISPGENVVISIPSGTELSAPDDEHIRIWIERYCTNEHIVTLLDTTLAEGPNPPVIWNGRNADGKNCRPGVYNSIIQTETSSVTTRDTSQAFLSYDNFYDFTPDDMEFNALTDSTGSFSLSGYCLPSGYSDSAFWPERGTFTITRYPDIWAVHDQYYNSMVDSVYISPLPLPAEELTIQLSR